VFQRERSWFATGGQRGSAERDGQLDARGQMARERERMRTMRLRRGSLIVAAIVLLAASTAALASEITFGSSVETNYFCIDGSAIFLSSSSNCQAGAVTFHGSAGVYFSPPGVPVLQGQAWALNFPSDFSFVMSGNVSSSINNGAGTSFTWGSDAANSLSGTVEWTLVKDHTLVPNLVGMLISPSGGTGVLGSEFPSNSMSMITLILDTSAYLDELQGSPANSNVTVRLSAAEVRPVPEQSTFILIGLGLLLTGGLVRKRKMVCRH
jgi:hypothetical protein